MARRTFEVIDLVEPYTHWCAGRPKLEVARSLGLDPKTVRKYVAAAEAAGLEPGGPTLSEQEWRVKVWAWFPSRYDTRLVQPTWGKIRETGTTTRSRCSSAWCRFSVIHQRLRDEAGLEVSAPSLRRYARHHFQGRARSGEVEIFRPPVDPGEECLCVFPHRISYVEPARMRRVGSNNGVRAGRGFVSADYFAESVHPVRRFPYTESGVSVHLRREGMSAALAKGISGPVSPPLGCGLLVVLRRCAARADSPDTAEESSLHDVSCQNGPGPRPRIASILRARCINPGLAPGAPDQISSVAPPPLRRDRSGQPVRSSVGTSRRGRPFS
jgi:hypothetical protein